MPLTLKRIMLPALPDQSTLNGAHIIGKHEYMLSWDNCGLKGVKQNRE